MNKKIEEMDETYIVDSLIVECRTQRRRLSGCLDGLYEMRRIAIRKAQRQKTDAMKKARAAGINTFQGLPCPNCGKTERYITTMCCKACAMKRMYKSYYKRKKLGRVK